MRLSIYYILILFVAGLQCKKNSESYIDHNQQLYNHNSNPGKSARDFLESTNYKSLKIEIQYMPGFKPDSLVIKLFVDLLNERLNKPSGIFIEQKQIDPTLKTIFTPDDISDIEYRNRTVFTKGDQLGAYIVLVSGVCYDGNILALAYKNTSICFFGESISFFSPGVRQEAQIKIMAMLLAHEFGHLIGLVDMGTPMIADHRDNINGNHCNNNACLMHHTYEVFTRDFALNFADIPSFDANCITDLRANGGK